jgi:hypothetical protein
LLRSPEVAFCNDDDGLQMTGCSLERACGLRLLQFDRHLPQLPLPSPELLLLLLPVLSLHHRLRLQMRTNIDSTSTVRLPAGLLFR